MMVKVAGTWINPAAITHITAHGGSARVHLLSGTYTDLRGTDADDVVDIIAQSQRPLPGI